MTNKYDWLVVGGGFRSLVAAYALAKAGNTVAILERGKSIGGILTPIKVAGRLVDRGPQFFENFNEKDKAFFEEMLGPDVLKDIGFEYRSFLNGKSTEGFAIPDWRNLGKETAEAAFNELLSARISIAESGIKDPASNARNLAELALYDGSSVLSDDLIELCRKFLCYNPFELSPLASLQVALFGRKLLLDQDISVDLKQSPLIDDFLAAAKFAVPEVRYNPYPKGQNIGVVRDAMEAAVINAGISVKTEHEILQIDAKTKVVTTSQGELSYDKMFWGCEIAETETTALGTQTIRQKIHLLPEVFHFFIVPEKMVHPAHYSMNYDLSHLSTRTTNFCNYIDCIDEDGNGIICVEQPIERESVQWHEPATDQAKIFEETKIFGNVTCNNFTSAESFKVPATYRVPKVGCEETVTQIDAQLSEVYGPDFVIPNPFSLTRKDALDDLRGMKLIS